MLFQSRTLRFYEDNDVALNGHYYIDTQLGQKYFWDNTKEKKSRGI